MTEYSVVPEGFESYVTDWKMSPGAGSGDFLFLTGMKGAGPDGSVDPDPVTQIRLAFERVGKVLAAAGGSFADVVEMTSITSPCRTTFQFSATFATATCLHLFPPGRQSRS